MIHEWPVASGATIYAGSLVATNANGELVHATAAASASGTKVVGVACATILAAPAGSRLKFQEGIFCLVNGGTFTNVHRLDKCYVVDDQTVDATNTNMFCGYIYEVDSQGVWVKISPFTPTTP